MNQEQTIKISLILQKAKTSIEGFENTFKKLSKTGRGELFLFNSIVGWMEALESNFLENNIETAQSFHESFIIESETFFSFPDPETAYHIYEKRFLSYQIEIDEVKAGLNSGNIIVPNYFYSKVELDTSNDEHTTSVNDSNFALDSKQYALIFINNYNLIKQYISNLTKIFSPLQPSQEIVDHMEFILKDPGFYLRGVLKGY